MKKIGFVKNESGLNGVGSNSNGLILWENDATRLRKVFRYLQGLREAIF